MANNWPAITLREAGVTLIDCDHRTPPANGTGYPYIAIPQLKRGRIDLSDVRRISQDHFEEWTRKAKPRPDDVILSRRCNPGETAVVPKGLECALGQNLVLLRADGSKVLPRFLRWLTRGPEWWEQIAKFLNVGAVFDSLKCADVPNFTLSIPSLPEQERIADILGTLDDKIELNRRTNETLEAMARSLFKSWFVDFGPVREKAAGRKPAGLDAETARLFPSAFEDSPLGKVPRAWRVEHLGNVAEINSSSISKAYPHDVIEYVDISSVTVGRLDGTTRYQLSAAPSRAKRVVRHGDTIWSCVRPNHRSYLFIHDPPENLVVSTGFAVLRATRTGSAFLHEWTTTDDFVEYLTANADGSAYPAVRPEHFQSAPMLVPPAEILDRYERIVKPMFDSVASNNQESRTLGAVRDSLLPKLLSGEVLTN